MEHFFGTLLMSSSRESHNDLPLSSARLPIDRLTWFGLAVAAAGWGILIMAVMLGSAIVKDPTLNALLPFRADLVMLAQTGIASGFALAAIGILRSGFGVLHRFFETVLDRSNGPKPQTVQPSVKPVVMEPEIDDEPAPPIVPTRERFVRSGGGKAAAGHNYVIRSDGSVEVETLLGTRIFATLDEAKDFIR